RKNPKAAKLRSNSPKMSADVKTLLKVPLPLPAELRPRRKSGQLRNWTKDPAPWKLMGTISLVSDPPNFKIWGPFNKLRVSFTAILFCVYVRGNADAILNEPRIFRLGSAFASFISPSATPTSDQLNGACAPVVVLVRTKPNSA